MIIFQQYFILEDVCLEYQIFD